MRRVWSRVAAGVGVVMAGLLGGAGCASVGQGAGEGGDAGYFLSAKQKGQLIGSGRIQDGQGIWYDVWVVPGYVSPAKRSATYLRRSGRDFGEYFQSQKYRRIAEKSGDAFEWAFDDCLMDFTLRETPGAWGRYWSAANQRTSQRVFGWWFAYPWALFESVLETAVRVPAGLTGTALGVAWGGAVVPSFYAVNSGVKGSWHLGVDAVALPAAAMAWNTAIAPPLALAGQKPSASRTDGFWVRQLGPGEARAERPPTAEEVSALAVWGLALMESQLPFVERRQSLSLQQREERSQLEQRLQRERSDVEEEASAAIKAVTESPALAEAAALLREGGVDAGRWLGVDGELHRYLQEERGMNREQAVTVLQLLQRYPPSAAPTTERMRPKTDPVQRGVDLGAEVFMELP